MIGNPQARDNTSRPMDGKKRARLPAEEGITDVKPRRKVRKHTRKPDGQPSRPLSAYNFFFKAERLRLLQEMDLRGEETIAREAEDDGLAAFSNADASGGSDMNKQRSTKFHLMGKVIGKRWKESLSAQQRHQYEIAAEEDMKRYRLEMEVYTDTMIRESSIGKKASLAGRGVLGGPHASWLQPNQLQISATASLPLSSAPMEHQFQMTASIRQSLKSNREQNFSSPSQGQGSNAAAGPMPSPLRDSNPSMDFRIASINAQPDQSQERQSSSLGFVEQSEMLITALQEQRAQQAEAQRQSSFLGDLQGLQYALSQQQEQNQVAALLMMASQQRQQQLCLPTHSPSQASINPYLSTLLSQLSNTTSSGGGQHYHTGSSSPQQMDLINLQLLLQQHQQQPSSTAPSGMTLLLQQLEIQRLEQLIQEQKRPP
jgi:hypothetical protein